MDDVILTRDLTLPGERAAVYRGVREGRLTRLARGAYCDAELAASTMPEERHRAAMRALSAIRPGLVFGGVSAALAWHRPLLGAAPAVPTVVIPSFGGGRTAREVTVHTTSTPFEVVDLGEVRATTLARALTDAGRVLPVESAVAMMDHALAPKRTKESGLATARLSRADLEEELSRGSARGRARARFAIEFADGDAGSPGESWCRVLIDRLGFARPVLQREFFDQDGFIGRVDFCWPQYRVVAEFDGAGKYQREALRGGRDPAQVVIDEKLREDRLRAIGMSVTRPSWSDLREPLRLREKLSRAGVPQRM